MKTYYVEYTYKNIWENLVSDRHCCETEKDAQDFIQQLRNNRELVNLTLIACEKII